MVVGADIEQRMVLAVIPADETVLILLKTCRAARFGLSQMIFFLDLGQ